MLAKTISSTFTTSKIRDIVILTLDHWAILFVIKKDISPDYRIPRPLEKTFQSYV